MTDHPIIYHGTPMTPRAALLAVLPGRAGCVSFYRPDDAEAVEAVCPLVMFRQRGVQLLDGRHEARRGVGRQAEGLETVLRMAGAAPEARTLRHHPRHARSAQPAQRRNAFRLAVRALLGRPALAHGRPAGTARAALRSLRQGGAGLDRRPEARACRMPALPRAHGRSGRLLRQPLARHAHDARRSRRLRLPFQERRQHQPRAEWMAL